MNKKKISHLEISVKTTKGEYNCLFPTCNEQNSLRDGKTRVWVEGSRNQTLQREMIADKKVNNKQLSANECVCTE